MQKTRTRSLRQKDYLSSGRQLNLTKLVDDALEALATIRHCGVGRNQRRSRSVIYHSFEKILQAAGYSMLQAHECWRNQVVALDELNANAEE